MSDIGEDSQCNENMNLMRQCLSDAGCNYDTMSIKEIIEMYKALRASQNTATQEEQKRLEQIETQDFYNDLRINSVPVYSNGNSSKIDDDVPKYGDISTTSEDILTHEFRNFHPKISLSKLILRDSSSKEEEEDEISSTVTVTKLCESETTQNEDDDEQIDVFNCVPTTHPPLAIVYSNPKYNPPIYCNPNITKLNREQRSHLLFKYHLLLAIKYNNHQRNSIHQAPWGNPIQTNCRFNGNLMRKLNTSFMGDTENSIYDFKNEDVELYVSQSGRQTKRRIYREDSDNSGEESTSKKSKTSNSTTSLMATNNKSESTKKRPVLHKMNNDEIIKRSKLFADKPKTRAEDMFDILVNQSHEKTELNAKHEKFVQSLKSISSDEEEPTPSFNVVDIIHDDDNFMRRKVNLPSSLGKLASRGKLKRGPNKVTKDDKEKKYDPLQNVASSTTTRSSSNKSKERCPVCNEEFAQYELLDHTPSCLDRITENDNSKRSNRQPLYEPNTITCKACDQVFVTNFDYEEHIHNCFASNH